MLQRRKERGRIVLSSVRVVESANISLPTGSSPELNSGDNNTLNNTLGTGSPLQVGYTDAGQDYTLYLVAHREQDRDDWINALRSGNKQIR